MCRLFPLPKIRRAGPARGSGAAQISPTGHDSPAIRFSLLEKLARIESVGAIVRFDATADVRMAAEILEGERREIGKTATGDKARNTARIEALCGLELFRSGGRSQGVNSATAAVAGKR